MRNGIVIGMIAAHMAMPLGSVAQSQAEKDPAAIAILSRAISALGAPLGSLNTAQASGFYVQYLAGGKTVKYEVKMIAAAPDWIRWETKGSDDTVIIVITGNSGWIQRRGQRRPLSLSDMAGRGLEKFPVLALAVWKDAPNVSTRYVGSAVSAGVEYQQVRVSKVFSSVSDKTARLLEQDTQADWFFDPRSGLPAWVRYYESPAKYGERLAVDLTFSDFRELGGIFTPMTMTMNIGKRIAGVVCFDSVKANVPLSPDDFKE